MLTLKIQIGPMVSIEAEGDSCDEITASLQGWERLNKQVQGLCTDLAERVYPEAEETKDETRIREGDPKAPTVNRTKEQHHDNAPSLS
ncbi:MAG: hypothetical protein JW768_00230 [Chitinispirillaceae bacterium]|nr:hypothetical protein [Chitinispirillaceae bacterium]